MEVSKIAEITPSNPATWVSQRGTTMYAFDVRLENGTHGSVNTMAADRWKVGDEVQYSARSTHHGQKLTLEKVGFGSRTNVGGASSDDTTKGIIASWAVGQGVNALGVCSLPTTEYWNRVCDHAENALEARKRVMNSVS